MQNLRDFLARFLPDVVPNETPLLCWPATPASCRSWVGHVQATEVASAVKRADAQDTPGRGNMLPRFEVG